MKIDISNTFDNFVVGKGNEKAYNSLKKIKFNKKYYLVGPKNSGKTHLLMAVKNANKDKNVLFETAEDINKDLHIYLNALVDDKFHYLEKYKNKYNIDILIIDNIENNLTFNEWTLELIQNVKCIIFASRQKIDDINNDKFKEYLNDADRLVLNVPTKETMKKYFLKFKKEKYNDVEFYDLLFDELLFSNDFCRLKYYLKAIELYIYTHNIKKFNIDDFSDSIAFYSTYRGE